MPNLVFQALHIPRAWLVGLLGDFYRAHPDVDLELAATKLSTQDKLSCLRTGEADISIRFGRPDDWPGFECIELTKTDLFPVCSPEYRAALGDCAEPRALLKATLLRSPRQPWAPWFAASGIECREPQQGPQFSDAALTLEAAARGQGVALARSSLAQPDVQAGRLVALFDRAVRSSQSYHAIYTHTIAERPKVRAFLTWISERAATSVAAPA